MKKPVYRLRELIREKYGEEKFATGVKLVGQWVSVTTGADWDFRTVMGMCNTTVLKLPVAEAEALRQLFGLKSIEDLLTDC